MSRKAKTTHKPGLGSCEALANTALIMILMPCTVLQDSISNLRDQAEACLFLQRSPDRWTPLSLPLLFALFPQLQYPSRVFRCDETSLSIVVRRECYGVTRELPSGLWLGAT